MARQALTDNLWEQLQVTMAQHGCYRKDKNREVMEAILWKLRTGASWRDIPEELCPWKTVLIAGQRLVCGRSFFSF